MRSPFHRVAIVIRERYRAGDTVPTLAYDYDIPEAVITAVVSAKKVAGGTRALDKWYATKRAGDNQYGVG
jgi:hypothetical protein